MDLLLGEVIKLAFSILAVILVPIIGAIAVKYLQKMGISLDAEKRARLEKLAQDAILAAEEWAGAKIKAQLPVNSGEKLQNAIAHLVDQLPGVTTEEATALINQELPKMRASAAGFLAATTTAVTQ